MTPAGRIPTQRRSPCRAQPDRRQDQQRSLSWPSSWTSQKESNVGDHAAAAVFTSRAADRKTCGEAASIVLPRLAARGIFNGPRTHTHVRRTVNFDPREIRLEETTGGDTKRKTWKFPGCRRRWRHPWTPKNVRVIYVFRGLKGWRASRRPHPGGKDLQQGS